MNTILYPNQAIPCTAGLCYAIHNGETVIQIQERNNSKHSGVYNGTIEIPVGVLDLEFENIFTAVEREIFEESGLRVKRIHNNEIQKTVVRNDTVVDFDAFCISQILIGTKPWICVSFVCEVEYMDKLISEEGETKNSRWITVDELKKMMTDNKDIFFPLTYPVLKKFLIQRPDLIVSDKVSIAM